jgi:TPR repeat protein
MRWNIRRGLAVAALLVTLFAAFTMLERTQSAGRPRNDGTVRVTACDRIAAHPSDTQKIAPGVEQDQVDIAKGKQACTAALKQQPGDGRTLYQLGRMFFYDKDTATGVDLFRQSAAAEYPQGMFVLGLVLIQGNGAEPNTCEGGRLWLKAARARHLYSKLYLANNWRDGMFKDCGLDTNDAEIARMLTAAEELIESPSEKDDVDQAKANWAKP